MSVCLSVLTTTSKLTQYRNSHKNVSALIACLHSSSICQPNGFSIYSPRDAEKAVRTKCNYCLGQCLFFPSLPALVLISSLKLHVLSNYCWSSFTCVGTEDPG